MEVSHFLLIACHQISMVSEKVLKLEPSHTVLNKNQLCWEDLRISYGLLGLVFKLGYYSLFHRTQLTLFLKVVFWSLYWIPRVFSRSQNPYWLEFECLLSLLNINSSFRSLWLITCSLIEFSEYNSKDAHLCVQRFRGTFMENVQIFSVV
jgi:hypothetical protein